MLPLIQHRKNCRACDCKNLDLIFSLKPSPIGDAYVTQDMIDVEQPSYPIDLYMCANCGLAQLLDVINPEILYGDYIYLTASSSGLSDHFKSYAEEVVSRCKPGINSLVIDIGSNDGTLLSYFKKMGMRVLGVEPATHIAAKATADGIESIDKYFTYEIARQIVQEHGHATLITANNVIANVDDLGSWLRAIKFLLADDGVFIFESYYLADLLKNKVFDFIYHEHVSAFSVKPIQSFISRYELELVAVEHVATKGGSLRYFIQKINGRLPNDGTVKEYIKLENKFGLYNKNTYCEFSKKINKIKNETGEFLEKIKKDNKTVVGFGASITCTTLIYHFEIGKYLDFLVDDNTAKQGRYSPGIHLPVFEPSVLLKKKPDYVVILAWRFADEIIKRNTNYLKNGGIFIIPCPEFKIIKWNETF